MRMQAKGWSLLFLLLILSWTVPASALDVSLVGAEPVVLTRHLAVLEDPTARLGFDEVRSPSVAARFRTDAPSGSALNYGLTRSAYWLRLTLANPGDRRIERMLQVDYPILSRVSLYSPTADGGYRVVETGGALPFDTRAYPSRSFVFPLELPPRSQADYYLRIQSLPPMIIPARLWEPTAFQLHERNDNLAQAGYFGMAVGLILFNLLLYLALRDSIYLLYVAFASCTVLAFASEYGMAKELLWPTASGWADISSAVLLFLAVATGLLFMRRMLDTVRNLPRLDRLFRMLIGLFLLAAVGVAASLTAFIPVMIALIGLTMLLALGASLYCARVKRLRSALFFSLAFAMLLLGALLLVLRGLGLLPTNILTTYGAQFGSGLEMLLLAFALADRFNTLRREKEAAQQTLVDHLKTHERELEERVAQRTEELNALNRRLEALSMTDGLTGIANRRHFDGVLAEEWNRALRAGQPLALALLDVDWFKRYNDRYGHQAGDECLRRVAGVLGGSVGRSSDFVARYGGEEFAFIAPGLGGEEALRVAERVCRALHELDLPHQSSDYDRVTCSIGVAACVPSAEDSADALLQAADAALYRAKAAGRNRAERAEG